MGVFVYKRNYGYSLLELLLVITIMSVIATISAVNLYALIVDRQIEADIQRLLSALELARSEAIKTGQIITFCRSSDALTCSGNWRDGQIMFIDNNGNRRREQGDKLLRVYSSLVYKAELHWQAFGADHAIQFSSHGMTHNYQAGRFIYYYDNKKKVELIINVSGRVRIEKYNNDGKSC